MLLLQLVRILLAFFQAVLDGDARVVSGDLHLVDLVEKLAGRI